MSPSAVGWFVAALVLGQAWTSPVVYHDGESRPLGVVSDIGQRLAAHSPRLQDSPGSDARLPLPSPQELDAIKKVAQILITLGEQVIPAIIGEAPPSRPLVSCDPPPVEEVPNDPVADN